MTAWLDQIDPGAHRRVKGLRLVTAFGLATMLGLSLHHSYGFPGSQLLSYFASGFALWASVSECQTSRWLSTRHFLLLNLSAVAGAMAFVGCSSIAKRFGPVSPECILVIGAFFVGYLKRFGALGAGVGSQIYIGQLLAYSVNITDDDLGMLILAGLVASLASIVPRLLSGPAEHPTPPPVYPPVSGRQVSCEMRMGLQAAVSALFILLLNSIIPLQQSAWAITASTYVIAGSAAGTADRVRRRIFGTLVGVPLGILCLPICAHFPALTWTLAAVAMMIYAITLPEHYDIACGAYAFTLMVTLAMTGETSISVLAARAWETCIGGIIGAAAAKFALPLTIETDVSGPRSEFGHS
jgi:hypothetical protein